MLKEFSNLFIIEWVAYTFIVRDINKIFSIIINDVVKVKFNFANKYFVDTVGKNETAIRNYIRNQMEEDYAKDQMSLKEYTDPFTGSKNKKA